MQIQRMKKTNKKVKMAVGGMTPTPKKMSLRDSLAASRARRQSFAAQRMAQAAQGTQPGRRAATPAERQAALLEQENNMRNKAANKNASAEFIKAQNKAMETNANNAKRNPTLTNLANTQQALKAPANVPQTNSAMQQFNTNQTNALAKNLAVAQPKNAAKSPVAASVTQANNATKLANMFKKPTAAPSPAAAPRSNRFSRQAAKAAPKPMMAKGGMVKSNCGASMKPTQKGKK